MTSQTIQTLDDSITDGITSAERYITGMPFFDHRVSEYLTGQLDVAKQKQLELIATLHGIHGITSNPNSRSSE